MLIVIHCLFNMLSYWNLPSPQSGDTCPSRYYFLFCDVISSLTITVNASLFSSFTSCAFIGLAASIAAESGAQNRQDATGRARTRMRWVLHVGFLRCIFLSTSVLFHTWHHFTLSALIGLLQVSFWSLCFVFAAYLYCPFCFLHTTGSLRNSLSMLCCAHPLDHPMKQILYRYEHIVTNCYIYNITHHSVYNMLPSLIISTFCTLVNADGVHDTEFDLLLCSLLSCSHHDSASSFLLAFLACSYQYHTSLTVDMCLLFLFLYAFNLIQFAPVSSLGKTFA